MLQAVKLTEKIKKLKCSFTRHSFVVIVTVIIHHPIIFSFQPQNWSFLKFYPFGIVAPLGTYFTALAYGFLLVFLFPVSVRPCRNLCVFLVCLIFRLLAFPLPSAHLFIVTFTYLYFHFTFSYLISVYNIFIAF